MLMYNVATGIEQQPRDASGKSKTASHCSANTDEDVNVLSSDSDFNYEGILPLIHGFKLSDDFLMRYSMLVEGKILEAISTGKGMKGYP